MAKWTSIADFLESVRTEGPILQEGEEIHSYAISEAGYLALLESMNTGNKHLRAIGRILFFHGPELQREWRAKFYKPSNLD